MLDVEINTAPEVFAAALRAGVVFLLTSGS
jgi:hypothetical protein